MPVDDIVDHARFARKRGTPRSRGSGRRSQSPLQRHPGGPGETIVLVMRKA